jgi:predicted PurR-regulated permease PerM
VRAIAIIITMILALAVLAGIFWLIIPPIISEFGRFTKVLTHYLENTIHTDSLPDTINDYLFANQAQIKKFLTSENFMTALKEAMPQLFTFMGETMSIIMSICASFITLLYMFFILQDYEYLTDNWIRIFPEKNRPFWRELSSDVARELNNYIRGQGTVALIMGIMFCIGFTIMDFPMAIGLGVMIGLMDLIPYLHTFALIPTAFLAMLKSTETGQNFWMVFGLAVGLFAIVQIITDMIVTPKVMGKAMGLNPAILLLSLSVWGALLGFIGLIIALPLTTLIIAYWQRYVTRETPIEEISKEKHDK